MMKNTALHMFDHEPTSPTFPLEIRDYATVNISGVYAWARAIFRTVLSSSVFSIFYSLPVWFQGVNVKIRFLLTEIAPVRTCTRRTCSASPCQRRAMVRRGVQQRPAKCTVNFWRTVREQPFIVIGSNLAVNSKRNIADIWNMWSWFDKDLTHLWVTALLKPTVQIKIHWTDAVENTKERKIADVENGRSWQVFYPHAIDTVVGTTVDGNDATATQTLSHVVQPTCFFEYDLQLRLRKARYRNIHVGAKLFWRYT